MMRPFPMFHPDFVRAQFLSGWHPLSGLTGSNPKFGPVGDEFVTVQQLDRAIQRSSSGWPIGLSILLILLFGLVAFVLFNVRISRLEDKAGLPRGVTAKEVRDFLSR